MDHKKSDFSALVFRFLAQDNVGIIPENQPLHRAPGFKRTITKAS